MRMTILVVLSVGLTGAPPAQGAERPGVARVPTRRSCLLDAGADRRKAEVELAGETSRALQACGADAGCATRARRAQEAGLADIRQQAAQAEQGCRLPGERGLRR